MAAMNPYAFRGWHLPSYADGANCDRNYHMYGSWPHSGYFPPGSVYSLQADTPKQHSNSDWKLNGLCTTSSEGTSARGDNSSVMKPGFESLLYKSYSSRGDSETSREESPSQRSCCAVSSTCSAYERLNVLDNSWRSPEVPTALDLNKSGAVSAYPSLCQRGEYLAKPDPQLNWLVMNRRRYDQSFCTRPKFITAFLSLKIHYGLKSTFQSGPFLNF